MITEHDLQSIRAANLETLNMAGFRPASWLPFGDSTSLRPVREIAQRAAAIVAVFGWVAAPDGAFTKEDVEVRIRRDGIDAAFTPAERELVARDRTEARQEMGRIGWKLENLWPLVWALGFAEAPSFEGQPIGESTTHAVLEYVGGRLGVDAFVRRVALRSPREIVALEDLFYCAHNAVRSAQMGHQTVPRGFHPVANGGVVHERRHALTWILSPGRAWDDTDLST